MRATVSNCGGCLVCLQVLTRQDRQDNGNKAATHAFGVRAHREVRRVDVGQGAARGGIQTVGMSAECEKRWKHKHQRITSWYSLIPLRQT